MDDITVNGRELAVEFEWAQQGFRLTAMEWNPDDECWDNLPGYDRVLCIMSTQFEALCGLASDLFDEAVWAEDMAEQLGIPMRFYDDEYDCDCCEDLETAK